MPLYEFRCPDCGALFTEITGAGTVSPPCAACGSGSAERVLSTFTAGPARQGGERFTPAMTRRDAPHHHHH